MIVNIIEGKEKITMECNLNKIEPIKMKEYYTILSLLSFMMCTVVTGIVLSVMGLFQIDTLTFTRLVNFAVVVGITIIFSGIIILYKLCRR